MLSVNLTARSTPQAGRPTHAAQKGGRIVTFAHIVGICATPAGANYGPARPGIGLTIPPKELAGA